MALDNLHILSTANLAYQFSGTLGRLPAQNRFAIFRYPYQMILQIVRCMAGLTIMFRAKKILKSSPKGEGFSPIPRKGHKLAKTAPLMNFSKSLHGVLCHCATGPLCLDKRNCADHSRCVRSIWLVKILPAVDQEQCREAQ